MKLFFLAINKFCFLFNKFKINIMNNKKGARALNDKKKCLKLRSWIEKNSLLYTYPNVVVIFSKLVSIHNQIAKNRNIYICLFVN